jgi:hypothetical protein
MMWFYEEHSRRDLLKEMGAEISWDTKEEFQGLLKEMKHWLAQPIRLDFGGSNGKNRKKRNVNAGDSFNESTVDLQQATGRSRNRKRRANSVKRLQRGT